MNGTIDDIYFEWLYAQVGDTTARNPGATYWSLLKELYTRPFRGFVPNDDNRVEDGKFLREEFLHELEISHDDPEWLYLQCSVLEMLVALARRASYNSYGEPYEWFWKFLENLGIRHISDRGFNSKTARQIQETLTILIDRTYSPNGEGGLFPLRHPEHDQRDVEIWYQLAAYLLEGDYLNNGPGS